MKFAIGCLRFVLSAICVLLLACNILFLSASFILGDYVPGIGNYRLMAVEAETMEPALSAGDAVLVNVADSYHLGDVVAFRRDGEITIHRIVGTSGGNFILKADAAQEESLLAAADLTGKVVLSVADLGGPLRFFQTPAATAVLLLALAVILLLPVVFRSKRNAFPEESGDNHRSASTNPQKNTKAVYGGRRHARRYKSE